LIETRIVERQSQLVLSFTKAPWDAKQRSRTMGKKKGAKEPMGSSQPAKSPPTQAKLELPHEELEEVRRIAKETGRSLTAFIRVAVREAVARHKKGGPK
jgi:Ribbon-helix-helix protein, copG family